MKSERNENDDTFLKLGPKSLVSQGSRSKIEEPGDDINFKEYSGHESYTLFEMPMSSSMPSSVARFNFKQS
jgi:hypothetical protein